MPHIGEKAEYATPRMAARAVTPTGSPFTYTAPSSGLVILSGGTVSLVEYGRDASFYALGVVAGPVNVARGDAVRLTYLVAPTITFVPA